MGPDQISISDHLVFAQEQLCEMIEKEKDPKLKMMLSGIESKVTTAIVMLGAAEAYVEKKK